MKLRNNNRFLILVALAALTAISPKVQARENISMHPGNGNGNRQAQLKTTAGCQPATSAIDIDINNIRARLMTGGDMWWNLGTQVAEYEVPKGSGKSSQFAASCWIGGVDVQGVLKVAAQTYRQTGNDYWPGILDEQASITSQACSDWDKFFRVYKSDINQFIELYKTGGNTNTAQFNEIRSWPAKGNQSIVSANGGNMSLPSNKDYAPFVDVDKNGVYDPDGGDYPDITGDEYIWWVFNDAGNVKEMSLTPSIGLEVQTSAFAYASQDFLNNATFYQYRVINRSNLALDSTYMAVWDDADLGWAYDDYIGCDTTRGLGILYNGKIPDGSGQVNSYGYSIPQSALDFFQGPIRYNTENGVTTAQQLSMTNFTYYNNDFSSIGNPLNGTEIYNYMTGSTRDGTRFSDDFSGPGIPSKGFGKGPISHFVYWGDPSDNSNWSECVCNNIPYDRRMIFSSGPFQLLPGAINNIIVGALWAPNVGGCPQTSFKTMVGIDDQAQALFENGFKTIEGPQAPVLTVRNLNKALVFYISNDSLSNNYKEQYGRALQPDTVGFYNVASVKASKILHNPDSLYKFEGYRVFQLANSQVTPAEIYGSDGTVDNTKAIEVFECDIHDSIGRIINYVKNTDISDTTWVPQIKVNGKDSGIIHSFELTQDAFATGNDKSLINYKTYYYVALAYAYNDFSYNKVHHTGGFNASKPDSTQDVPYLESSHGFNSTPINVVAALPNPANGAMGTVLNADYNTGVTITRITGTGNGGNALQIDQATEDAILANNIVDSVTYVPGSSPVNVKVVDPVALKAMNWQLFINGPLYGYSGTINTVPNTPEKGIQPDSASWFLVGYDISNPAITDTIYNEYGMSTLNEQLLQNYGLSVSIQQVARPGDFELQGNGYISSDVTFVDPSKPWLAGVPDGSDSSVLNWIRSGNNTAASGPTSPCNYNDSKLDTGLAYGNMLSNNTLTTNTWAPYAITAPFSLPAAAPSDCGFAPAKYQGTDISTLPSVDVVFTNDMSKWTRCVVFEMQEDKTLAQGGAARFSPRSHASWNKEFNADGSPQYSNIQGDTGMSWFPGYAINQETGERLNIIFGEDSWLSSQNGADMIWNPTSDILSQYDGSVLFGGKHFVYILGSRYDQDSAFKALTLPANLTAEQKFGFAQIQWAGIPIINPAIKMLPLNQGYIPTETRLRFRVTRPYSYFNPNETDYIRRYYYPTNPTPKNSLYPWIINGPGSLDSTTVSNNLPHYVFSTKDLAPTPVTDHTDKNALLDRIFVVPNPYYGYSGYEQNRLDTKVRIINLPARATVVIYALDGTLIRTLSKSDPNVSYLDWDVRNAAGLPVASGMYLMDVKADGIGETVLRWFGAMRPTDITTY